jgi:UDP-2-acetamido-2-deoxy-ribo-hexuluronate aminotransferase
MIVESMVQSLPFIDLSKQQIRIKADLQRRIQKVLDHGQFILGPEIEELEERLAHFVGVKHCVSVSSGTDALLIAMLALDIAAGDEILTTPFTFFATGEMIELILARATYADIEKRSFNLDPRLIESRITPKTKAIVPVSLYGQCADFDSISAVAKKYSIPVIEDAAQSFGAIYKGRRSCSLTEISCTSFFPSKPLGAYGDGGACFTNDSNLALRMKEIRNHGQESRYYHTRLGLNGRMDTLQAAVLLAKLPILEDELKLREEIGKEMSSVILAKCGDRVGVPQIEKANVSVYAQYTVTVDNRASVMAALKEQGVPTAVHYPMPLPFQPVFAKYAYKKGDFPVTEWAAERVMSLPMHPYLEPKDIQRIANALANSLT